ncbi:MAG: hypothetical protein A2649_00060 [Candidatus Yanofskybacteria bacterium RIFCSPHIGHO2_01_FULL_41_26]|uniref:Macrocin-O-methyltransferase n=1 Tax=Candidatus Yanofskybacteria bacterium RIFCSPHIGHO2_01_FULL_41_26 TaxID=1802661 RepID=A0A1F8ECS3_9BACT|nr:MAG: hypothetical protein A2649_00060 [Candidatus Yanofskybacteria bacterium RIFCSPHIGHO2_01_FULL_41_26]
MSHIELGKLKYYKRNPLEEKAFKLVSKIYSEEEGPVFVSLFTGRKPVLFSPGELLNIWEQSRIMVDHGGAYAEVGVFRGASAKAISEIKGNTPLHLFDTFEGLPDQVSNRDGRFKKEMFTASEKEVRDRLSKYPAVKIYPGLFPNTADAIKDLRFSFVHLDVDLYSVTKKALEFFYPRMLSGGRILSHDYGQCKGVWTAFDEFMADKPEKLQPMEATQVLMIKK